MTHISVDENDAYVSNIMSTVDRRGSSSDEDVFAPKRKAKRKSSKKKGFNFQTGSLTGPLHDDDPCLSSPKDDVMQKCSDSDGGNYSDQDSSESPSADPSSCDGSDEEGVEESLDEELSDEFTLECEAEIILSKVLYQVSVYQHVDKTSQTAYLSPYDYFFTIAE